MNIDRKISTAIAFLIIFLVIAPAAWAAYRSWRDLVNATTFNDSTAQMNTKNNIPSSEKQKIDAWIASNNLNEFGDPQGTVYAGGTPLFDESTGKTIDKYEYILQKHPDRPWDKS